jgi:uncharacterized membrane protein YphA (DoxX/SURF4 family)
MPKLKGVDIMWQIVLRIGIGFLLIIHGFAHWQITTGWGAKSSASSWMLTSLEPATLQALGTLLWVASLLAFIAAGILLFIGVEWWRVTAVVSSLSTCDWAFLAARNGYRRRSRCRGLGFAIVG